MPGCSIADVVDLVDQLPGVTRSDNGRYWRIAVSDRTFGYLWEPTRTVGLKQTIAEQLALVAERPETFEVQFTTGAYGWVVVQLGGGRAGRAVRARLRGLAAHRPTGAGRSPQRPVAPLSRLSR